MAVLAAVSFVLIASLLMFNASDNDGEGSDDTTDDWSEANAVIFTSGQSAGTYYKTIQGAVDAAEAAAEESGLNSVTIYVKGQTVTESISVDYVKAVSGNGFLEITIRGIASEPTGDPGKSSPVTITKDDQLKGPVFHVEGRLILDGITIVDEQETPSNGDESQSAPAIEVVSTISDIRNGELELLSSYIGSESQQYPGVAIDVSGGRVHIDENSKLYSVVSSDQGVITARSSAVYVYGSVFGNPAGDGYEIYTMCEDVVRSNSGIGLTIYVNMTSEIDVRLGVPDGSMDHSLWIKHDHNDDGSDQQVDSYENRIDITLQDGFPLGTSIVHSEVGADVVCSEVEFGWSSNGDDSYCYLVTPRSEDDYYIIITDEETPVSGKLITFTDGDEVVFAGIAGSNGSVSYPSDLSGLYSLSIEDRVRGSVGLGSGSGDSVEAGPAIITTGDILVRSVTTGEFLEIGPENSIKSERTDTPSIISGSLSSRQTIWESYNIYVGAGISSLVFSLELPSGIDTDRVILFREHTGTAAEMDFVSASGFWGRGDDCFTVESIGGKDYITIRSSQFSVFSVGEEEPVPPERTVVTAVIEDRQVRISVGPESYKEYSVRDSEGNLLLGWQSGASGLTIRFDLLPPGAEYRVMGRYAGTTSEILEATIVAPKDPVIEVVSVGVDSVILSSEEMVEYRLLLEDGTPVGGWVPGDGEDMGWADLDPTLDYYAEATSTSDGMTLSTGPVLVKAGVSAEVTGVMKHGGAFLVVTGIGQGLSCTADAAVYHSSGTSVTFGPIQTGTVTLTFTGSDGGEVRTMEVLVPPVPQDSRDDADVITIDSLEGVMYRLHDHTGAVVSDGWVHGGGELSWSVDPSKGYFVTMVTGNEGGAVLFPMVEVKRPAEMLASGEAA